MCVGLWETQQRVSVRKGYVGCGRNSGTRHFSIRVCGMTSNRIWVFPESCCARACVCMCVYWSEVCVLFSQVQLLVQLVYVCSANQVWLQNVGEILLGCCTIQKIFKETLICTWNYEKKESVVKASHSHTHSCTAHSFIHLHSWLLNLFSSSNWPQKREQPQMNFNKF